ncbi:MAG: translation initiation factor IF-2 [Victivallaceae bacterium]|nr:translation initiation factor IF-2 [Victivallaceae bacterium]
MKKLKVKNIAETYGVSPKTILEELAGQGIELKDAADLIPADLVTLVEDFFSTLYREKKAQGRDKKAAAPAADQPKVTVQSPIVVKNLAAALDKKPNVVISDLMKLGELASINMAISEATARKLCKQYGVALAISQEEKKQAAHREASAPKAAPAENPADLRERPPIVTFMGHVDHGKTSLQDAVRHTHVVDGEAGKITQHIGASTVTHNGKQITFIDTPGHEAFTQMRARGANVTDIVVLVVAANEGFKPQTVEAMNHALAAKVPIIVAANKIDLPDADLGKVNLHMQQNNLMCEEWGGEIGVIPVSAKTGKGLNDLLDRILLESEMMELKANPKLPAEAVVLESQQEMGLGATASVMVRTGTLHLGDFALCGEYFGRIRLLFDDKGKKIKSAGPSTPVKVVGLSGIPDAGAQLTVCNSEKEARLASEQRAAEKRGKDLAVNTIQSAEDLFSKLQEQEHRTLKLIIKSDVRGSGEAIEGSLEKLPSEKISVNVIANSVGSITENDVMLAAASEAIIVGFHVRVNPGVNELAKKQNVEIRLYSIIYELLEDITDALTGRLAPEKREKTLGKARILQIFELHKGPKVCGCIVDEGSVKVGSKARVFRGKHLIYNGEVASLRRFQDDVKEVKVGLECGIRLDNFADFEEGDIIDIYEIELKKATLE